MNRRSFAHALGLVLGLALVVPGLPALSQTKETPMTEPSSDPENTLVITLKSGEVRIALLAEVAPKHVERIKALARAGEYDGVVFHRVIEGFMAQTGDVEFGDGDAGFNARRVGTGGSDQPDLPAEFSEVPFERGTVGMARSQDPDSANSQFFIMFAPGDFLNGKYTVFGQVVSGMEHVDAIRRGEKAQNGAVKDPDAMISVRVLADL
jgi:cyclophilin family peptidyl-prolyl cis-trans isomerase